jgi:predicted amidohydrolase YtcJ
MWTYEAAYSVFQETERGSLTPGKAADFVVLSANPLTSPTEAWGEAVRVEMTVVGGEIVYDAEAGPCPSRL